jgi:hypothetical protein
MTLVEVHPQLSNKRHPVDGALVGARLLWPMCQGSFNMCLSNNEFFIYLRNILEFKNNNLYFPSTNFDLLIFKKNENSNILQII